MSGELQLFKIICLPWRNREVKSGAHDTQSKYHEMERFIFLELKNSTVERLSRLLHVTGRMPSGLMHSDVKPWNANPVSDLTIMFCGIRNEIWDCFTNVIADIKANEKLDATQKLLLLSCVRHSFWSCTTLQEGTQ
jgi:hypothetical protein